jgi:hypothetical protein
MITGVGLVCVWVLATATRDPGLRGTRAAPPRRRDRAAETGPARPGCGDRAAVTGAAVTGLR